MFDNTVTSEFPKTGIPKADALNFRDYRTPENIPFTKQIFFLFKSFTFCPFFSRILRIFFSEYGNLENSGHQILVFLFRGILKFQCWTFLVFLINLGSIFQDFFSRSKYFLFKSFTFCPFFKNIKVGMAYLKIKRAKNFWPSRREFEPQIFSNFPAPDLNFHGKWGRRDQVKTSF